MAELRSIRLANNDAANGQLPPVCMRTGEPTDNRETWNFATTPPWTIVLFLVIGILAILPMVLLQKKARLTIPMAGGLKRRIRTFQIGGLTLFFAGIFGVMVALIAEANSVWVGVAAAAIVAGLTFAVIGSRAGLQGKVDDTGVDVKVHPAFASAYHQLQTQRAAAAHPPPSIPLDPSSSAQPWAGVPPPLPVSSMATGVSSGIGAGAIIAIVAGVVLMMMLMIAIAIPTFLGARERAQERAAEQAATQTAPTTIAESSSSADSVPANSTDIVVVEVDPLRLVPGTCYQDPDADTVFTVDTVDCSQPHTSQAMATLEYDGATFPGQDALFAFADEGCFDPISRVIVDDFPDDLLLEYWVPDEFAWKDGIHHVICSVLLEAGSTSDFYR